MPEAEQGSRDGLVAARGATRRSTSWSWSASSAGCWQPPPAPIQKPSSEWTAERSPWHCGRRSSQAAVRAVGAHSRRVTACAGPIRRRLPGSRWAALLGRAAGRVVRLDRREDGYQPGDARVAEPAAQARLAATGRSGQAAPIGGAGRSESRAGRSHRGQEPAISAMRVSEREWSARGRPAGGKSGRQANTALTLSA